MRDADIRRVLLDCLQAHHSGELDTLIVEELGLCRGTVRADLAVVNGLLKGFEIKSDQDTLIRLPNQAAIYSRVFDTVTIVVAERHLKDVESAIPTWWGIQVAECIGGALALTTVRDEAQNPNVEPQYLVELLWRNEVLELLNRLPSAKSLKGKPRRILWDALATAVSLADLKQMVRLSLKNRNGWRAVSRQTRGGEKSLPSAMSLDCLCPHARPRSRRYMYRPN